MREHFAHDIGQRLAAKIRMADPTRALWCDRVRGDVRDVDDELERKMRERVGDDAAHASPLRPRAPQPRAELRAALQERWQASLRERARLAPRSNVPVLDALLTAQRPLPDKIRSQLAPKIGHSRAETAARSRKNRR